MEKGAKKLIANNKKVYHEYFLEEIIEAGIALHGTEVKSIRMGKCSIKESFVRIEKNGEVLTNDLTNDVFVKGIGGNNPTIEQLRFIQHLAHLLTQIGNIA